MAQYRNIAFIFPGQGAQVVGMGKDFSDSFAHARQTFQEGDDLLKRNLSKIIFEGPVEELTETRNSQTGIFLNSIALLRVIQNQFPQLQPHVCAGLSLGEYTALCCSQKIPFEAALKLVQYRGECMNEACEQHKGTMAAIFGLSAEEVEEMVKELNLPNDLWVANFNCPGQTVISGTLKGVEAGSNAAKAKNAKRVLPLTVHGAFHSGLMRTAQDKLEQQIAPLSIADSSIQMVMNVPGNYVKDSHHIKSYMISQVTSPVRWEQSIKAMNTVDLFVEIGCGKVLSGLNRQIGVTAPTINVSKVADLETLAKALE
jgi:[acyl-carrier-protein] S-malonyltransferase